MTIPTTQAPTEATATPAGENAGNETPAPVTPEQTTDTTSSNEPYFTAKTREEFEARFGATRVEGRLALAKKYEYDTVEEMDAAMAALKAKTDSELSDVEKYKKAAKDSGATNAALSKENRSLKIGAEVSRSALAHGVDPKQADAVEKLRDASDTEVDESGNVDAKAISDSVKKVVTKYPWLKQSAPVIGGGTNASAASSALSLDQQIAEATKNGNTEKSIALQMSKLGIPT